MSGHLIIKYEGYIKVIATKVAEDFIKREPAAILKNSCQPFIDFSFKIDHVDDGHEIVITVIQGIKPIWDTNVTVLSVNSSSEFKVIPLDKSVFDKSINDTLMEFMLDFTRMAISNNSGMLSLLASQSNFPEAKVATLSIEDLKGKIRNELRTVL
jgi:hypothetical protein